MPMQYEQGGWIRIDESTDTYAMRVPGGAIVRYGSAQNATTAMVFVPRASIVMLPKSEQGRLCTASMDD